MRRDNILGDYVIHTAEIPVPIHLDSDEIVCRLKAVLEPMCTPYVPAIQRHLENVQAEKLFITPAARPRVTRVPHVPHHCPFRLPRFKAAGNPTGRHE